MKSTFLIFSVASLILVLQGCATSCDNYQTYDMQLNRLIGKDVSSFEYYYRANPLQGTDQLARNQLRYHYNNNKREFNKTYYCKTNLIVDRSTGKIVSWEYEGECYMWGYCPKK